MAAFNYIALNPKGQEVKGVLEGDSERQIRTQLRAQSMTPLEVKPVKRESSTTEGKFSLQFKAKLTVTDLALITRQMATLLGAGIPLEEVLFGVAEQTEKPKVKSIILGVRAKVLEGYTLADGLGEFPQSFTNLYRSTVAAGEQSGHLDIVLNRLADYTEQQYETKKKVQQAMIYPIIMTIVSIAILVFLMIFVVPKMVGVFTSTHQTLPGSTQFLISISDFIKSYGLYLAGIIVVGIYFFRRSLKRSPEFRAGFHKFILKVPVIGNAIKVVNTARYARTFGILSSAGVPVLEAMRISAELVTNIPMRNALDIATGQVREGTHINRALKQTTYFPPMSIHLIASGESSGKLEDMLERAANNQEREVRGLIDSVLTLFEPILILVMGAIVLFIVLAIMLPIFGMDQYG